MIRIPKLALGAIMVLTLLLIAVIFRLGGLADAADLTPTKATTMPAYTAGPHYGTTQILQPAVPSQSLQGSVVVLQ